jgi:hypothetical protein
MYCKKCRFHSFDHVATCPKCGADWEETRKALYLNWITASGVNWIAPAVQPKAEAVAAPAGEAGDSAEDYIDVISQTPPSAPRDEDLDVSLFPELDLSVDEPKTQAAPTPPAPPAPKPAPKGASGSEEDLFLDSMPVDDAVELDFSATFDEPEKPTPPPVSKPKREDLFIPELEEMLAPLTDEPRQNPEPAKKPAMSDESEILLDFGNDSDKKGPKSDADDIPFLELDDNSKSS